MLYLLYIITLFITLAILYLTRLTQIILFSLDGDYLTCY